MLNAGREQKDWHGKQRSRGRGREFQLAPEGFLICQSPFYSISTLWIDDLWPLLADQSSQPKSVEGLPAPSIHTAMPIAM